MEDDASMTDDYQHQIDEALAKGDTLTSVDLKLKQSEARIAAAAAANTKEQS